MPCLAGRAGAAVDLTFEVRRSQQAGAKPQTSLRPRDPNATAAALSSRAKAPTKPAAVSLSSLLQSRSDAASAPKPARRVASPLPDIDSNDRTDPLAATDYVHNIYSYYRRVEPKFRVDPGYMATQVLLVALCMGLDGSQARSSVAQQRLSHALDDPGTAGGDQ
jgi:hypothetical protein